MDKKRTGESLKDLFKENIEVSSEKSRSQRAKALKRHNVKMSKGKRKHTIYLSPEQSKKLRLYAAENDMQLSEIIEKLINENL